MVPPPDPGRPPSRISRATRAVGRKIEAQFSRHGWAYRKLAVAHATNVAGDALVALALADTLFFSVPAADARANVVLFLLLTLAPFALVGPLLGMLADRTARSHRAGLSLASLGRVVLTVALVRADDGIVTMTLVFALLVLSRTFGISRSSILPTALPDTSDLVEANARLARLGILAGGVILPLGLGLVNVVGSIGALVPAVVMYAWSTVAAIGLKVDLSSESVESMSVTPRGRVVVNRKVIRYARLGTAIVRLLNGYLLLLLAFVFRDDEAGIIGFGTLLLAAAVGFGISSLVAQFLARRLREAPMVIAALALEAAASFIAAHVFATWSAAALALFAGLAWGMAKFGHDALLHETAPPARRGRMFTTSETMFQLAWVVGAIIPTLVPFPATLGLVLAGCAALGAQVILVNVLLISLTEPFSTTRSDDLNDSIG